MTALLTSFQKTGLWPDAVHWLLPLKTLKFHFLAMYHAFEPCELAVKLSPPSVSPQKKSKSRVDDKKKSEANNSTQGGCGECWFPPANLDSKPSCSQILFCEQTQHNQRDWNIWVWVCSILWRSIDVSSLPFFFLLWVCVVLCVYVWAEGMTHWLHGFQSG